MKQQITPEQWVKLKNIDRELFWQELNYHYHDLPKDEQIPNIGQMIEFLGEGWWHEIEANYYNDNPFVLADTLWEAIKIKLKK